MPLTYPLDTTGLSPGNLITDEVHVLTETNSSTYRIIIPEFAPFYLDNLVVRHTDITGVVTVLTADVDYYVCLPYIGASRSIGKMLYGGITINTSFINGLLKVSYQTLGGDWVANSNYVKERLAELVYNPKVTVWDVVTDKPNQFPPINHSQEISTVYGFQQLIDAVNELALKIAEGPSVSNEVVRHFTAIDNPHQTTKDQVGLGDVSNLPVAEDTEVADKNPLDKYVTLRQLVTYPLHDNSGVAADITAMQNQLDALVIQLGTLNDSLAAQTLAIQEVDTQANTTSGLVTTLQESMGSAETNINNLNISLAASQIEIAAIANQITVIQDSINTAVLSLNAHSNNTNNPHSVTKDQVGLSNVSNLPVASSTEVSNQTSVDKYVLLSQVLTLLQGYSPSTPASSGSMTAKQYFLMGN